VMGCRRCRRHVMCSTSAATLFTAGGVDCGLFGEGTVAATKGLASCPAP
jgi:hypothetical protein